MNHKCLIISYLLSFFCFNSIAQKNFPDLKYDDGTLGKEIQPYFISHCKSCSFFKTKKIEKFQATKDFVVRDLKTEWDVTRMLETPVQTSIASLNAIFSHIHPSRQAVLLDKYPASPFLRDIFKERSLNPVDDLNNTTWSKDCHGYFDSNTKAGLNFGKNSLTSALEVDKEHKSQVLVKYGTFLNPVADLLANRDPELLFKIWNLYLNKPSARGNAAYLEQLEAVIVAKQTDTQKNTKFKAEATLQGGLMPEL